MRTLASVCALAALAACTRPSGAVLTYKQAPAQVTALAPERPRYVYVPKETGDLRLPAARIEVSIRDGRAAAPALHAPDLALPADLDSRAAARLSSLVTAAGAPLRLEGRVEQLEVVRTPGARSFAARIAFTLSDAAHGLLLANTATGAVQVLDPPYDGSELDELRMGVLLEALDAFLANDSLLSLIAQRLGTPP